MAADLSFGDAESLSSANSETGNRLFSLKKELKVGPQQIRLALPILTSVSPEPVSSN